MELNLQQTGDHLQNPLLSLPTVLSSFDGTNHGQIFTSVAAHFHSKFGAIMPESMMQVPVLTRDTADTLPPNSLVRFRGMVSDMFNPEFFVGAYKAAPGGPWQPAALYTDAVPDDIDAAAQTSIMERRPLLVTPVPHEQAWASAAWTGRPVEPPTPRPTDRSKRGREASNEAAAALAADAAAVATAAGQAVKVAKIAGSRDVDALQKGEVDTHPAPHLQDQDMSGPGGEDQQQQGPADAAVVDEHEQQQPAFQPGDCIVQVYGEVDKFQLHDVVEVLGVTSVIPGLAALHMDRRGGAGAAAAAAGGDGEGQQQQNGHHHHHHGDGMDVDDDMWGDRTAALPPTSQVMRLHALAIRKLPPHPSASSLAGSGAASINTSNTSSSSAVLLKSMPGQLAAALPLLRQRALSLLAAPLAGDELAAEYLLLAVLGSVVNRENGGAVGVLPLNLSHCPSSAGSSKGSQVVPGLAAALRCLLPHVALLPLSLPALNHTRWYPQQCGTTGRLFRGCLQLTDGTVLLLDETDMAAGQLGDAGVKNLQALHRVLTHQQLPCGCHIYTHNLHVNQPAVVLSSGRSILRDVLAIQVPLQPQRPVLVKPGGPAAADPSSNAANAAAAAVVDWGAADVLGPEAVAAAAAAMPELGAVRDYLAAARSVEVKLDQSAAEQCVARFRAQQQVDPSFGLEELNNIITLSKLLSASLGHDVFSIDSWERVMQMEQMRKQRVAAMQPVPVQQ